ncbi:MAG: tetratricopeptide repeat protein [Planctomycetota bacterium]|nr:tetratricopeptide repeat protein [Planctomycetota bacterium]
MSDRGPAPRPISPLPHVAAVALAGLAALAGCGEVPEPATQPGAGATATLDSTELRSRRDLAAALFGEDRFAEALDELAPLLAGEAPRPADLCRAGVLLLALKRPDEARAHFERALAAEPDSPVALFNLGGLAATEYDYEAALASFERAHDLAPEDLPTELALANTLVELERFDEADAHYAALQARGVDVGASWFLSVLHRRSGLLMLMDQDDEGLALLHESEQLRARGVVPPSLDDLQRGNFGRLLPPAPLGLADSPALVPPALGEPVQLGFTLALEGLLPVRMASFSADDGPVAIGPTDWLGWGPGGLALLAADGTEERLSEAATARAFGLDLEDDGDLDVLALDAVTGELRLFLREDAGWSQRVVATLPSAVADATLVDFDHEGDLDLCLVGDFGIRLLRNDGAELAEGGFTDATLEAGLGGAGALGWCLAEDFDTDQDVDLMFGGAGATLLADNLRGGRFDLGSDFTGDLPTGLARPVAFDHDNDARPDLAFGDGRWFHGRADRSFEAQAGGPRGALAGGGLDLDANGSDDAFGRDQAGALGLWLNGDAWHALALEVGPAATVLWADGDGSGAEDLVTLEHGVAWLRAAAPPLGKGIRLGLAGVKDNARGIGAIVEVSSGGLYRRSYARGNSLFLGLGDRDEAEVLRITWPNGVVQSLTRQPAGADLVVAQKKGLVGSCPFLYSWNGTEYTFISDVLGITPLGLPMAPGMFVPPDHDEYVLVTGEQLVAREDGGGLWYDLQFTEELREVTYLDQAKLIVVDHPVGTEIYPDERFCFPPFPGEHTHIAEDVHAPVSAREVDLATGSPDGRDWAPELAAIDGDYAEPFVHHRGRFQGLAKPHVVELAFDPADVADAEQLRLLMTGWFFWTDASVNMAAARTPGVDFVPPIFSVPDPTSETGWRELGPPFGFPAGKTKTMVADLTGQLDPADPRLRIFCTLRLYWDAIRLATDGDDAPMLTHELAVHSSELWERGFSRPVKALGLPADLEWFDWSELEPEPRWNQHPGRYTRLGEVTPLLEEAEDQFVILGAGDALHLRFDASGVPPLAEGLRRDYLLYLDGWAKDRDPNAVDCEFVEPMPFHGMSGFPYGPAVGTDESFPDTPELRAWAAEWNTREAKAWIEPLAPVR